MTEPADQYRDTPDHERVELGSIKPPTDPRDPAWLGHFDRPGPGEW